MGVEGGSPRGELSPQVTEGWLGADFCPPGHPSPAARDRLRGRAPLSLRDISPHCGESPLKGEPSSMATRFGPGGVNVERSEKA